MIKQSILVVLGFLLFLVGTANADRITIINSALNGGSYTWDLARADINSNFVELYTQHDLITVTGPVDLDTLDTLSHVAVTLGTSNGLSLSTQALSLDLATNVSNGAMPSSWVVFLESIDTEAKFKALYNLEIGVDVQAFNAYLDMVSGLTPAANALLGWDGTGTNIINITEIADSNIPSNITRDAELTAALSNLNGSNITSGTVGESYIDVLIARVSQLFDPDNPGEIGAVTPGKVNATELNVVAADGARTIVLDENTTPITPGVGEAGFTNTAGTLQYYNDDGVLRDVGSGGGTLTITEQATDPLFSGMSTGDLIVSRASGDMFYKSATGGYQLTGTYTADPIIPVVSGVTIDGTTLVITYDINVTQGVGYNDNLLNIDGSTMGSDVAVTYASGDGTPAHTYTAATAAVNGETVTLDFLGGADALESSTGGDLAAFTGQTVVNNTAPAGGFILNYDFDTNWTDGYTTGGTDSPAAIALTINSGLLRETGTFYNGTQSAHILGIADNMELPISDDSYVMQDGSMGYFTCYVYRTVQANDTQFFNMLGGAGEVITASMRDNGRLTFSHTSNAGANVVSMSPNTTFPINTWIHLELWWDNAGSLSGGATLAIRIADGTQEYEADADTPIAWVTDATSVYFGANTGAADDYYMDAVTLNPTF